jgi:predicted nucleic acid-binding protein
VNVYLDTSAVLRVLLRRPKPLAIWGRWERAYASGLLHVEACRVIDRLRLEGALDDQGVADARQQLGLIGFVRTSATTPGSWDPWSW